MIYNLDRFILAQENDYATALAEITNGHKQSHWIWYIFPQLEHEFPGQSYNNKYYSLKSLEEARAYMANEILSNRLIEISSVILALENNNPDYVMSSRIDAQKLRSSMTLFSIAAPEQIVFGAVLEKYFQGKRCEWTVAALNQT